MRIGGLQKHSFIDYPGKISCVLFLAGCNFSCPYCHNPQLVGSPGVAEEPLTIEDFLAFLAERRGLLEGVVISGGEPTLHSDLPDLCRRIKHMGYAVKMDTNGSRPQMLRRLITENLVDYLAMDIKMEPDRYVGGVTRQCDTGAILDSLELLMASGIDHEFRTTCVKPLVTSETIECIARLIQGSRLYALQPFKASRLLRPDYFNGADPSYSEAEMDGLQRIAAAWVETCTRR
jgi:pyruvate formate lyase activating enzyme